MSCLPDWLCTSHGESVLHALLIDVHLGGMGALRSAVHVIAAVRSLTRCCRYPFHLRPKNRQAFQYLQMAVEIINDLELDQDPEPENRSLNVSDERLEKIRTYLAAYYLVCT